MMKKILRESLKNTESFEEVLSITVKIISEIKKKNLAVKIGYVSGKVTADGEEYIADNLARLHKFTEQLEKVHGEYIFSAADVFSDEIYWKINLPRPIHETDFYTFWRKVVSSGVTDIYMTPEWEKSTGAKDEHEIATKLQLKIHYVEE